MRWSARLPILTQTLFAQLQQTVSHMEILQSVAGLGGNFSKREIQGKTYWYYRFSNPGEKETQIYLGPDSPNIQKLVDCKSDKSVQPAQEHIRRLARGCVGAGCIAMNARQFKLIKQLAHYGFFHAGGILAGTHAFAAYANMLGIEWSHEAFAKTVDVDFAHAGRNISVALPSNLRIDTSSAIESLEEGFLPRIGLSGRSGSWVHATDRDYVIDFITPRTSECSHPFEFEPLGIALQPLRFLEFSLINVQQTVLISSNDAIIVNLPDPARYALHKLIVYAERKNDPKAQKDLQQSAALLEILKEDRPEDLIDAWSDLNLRGPGWRQRAFVGLQALESKYDLEPLANWVEDFKKKAELPNVPAWRERQ